MLTFDAGLEPSFEAQRARVFFFLVGADHIDGCNPQCFSDGAGVNHAIVIDARNGGADAVVQAMHDQLGPLRARRAMGRDK